MEEKTSFAMTVLLCDNIVSALGFTAAENYRRVKEGVSGLARFEEGFGLPEPFVASAIDSEALDDAFNDLPRTGGILYSKLEKAAIVSIAGALKGAGIDPASRRTLFILSSTKGNIFLLNPDERRGYEPDRIHLWRSAELIAGFFGNPNTPWVISNACISGACALIAAQRALEAEECDCAVVTGADMLSRFVLSGFQSFKALSQEFCRPFDANRAGLNLGETAATIVLTRQTDDTLRGDEAILTAGAVRNDANHISGPSRTGEGAFLALQHVLQYAPADELAFINAHGTATPYNDEMEAIAITRAGAQHIPVTSLKGYFGHTLGNAGVLESIISTRALKDGTILKTNGFEQMGVAHPLCIATHNRPTSRRRCINMLSGFGGCNAAILYSLANHPADADTD
jgi:3-oxoacyl-[acyl-carrier-protein] synthase-1